jgi:thiamine biosynthesis lipoprotein ApbE
MGFDEDWMEVSRPLVDEDLVDAIEAQLEESALSVSGDYYRYFEFDGFSVCWGYASFDI